MRGDFLACLSPFARRVYQHVKRHGLLHKGDRLLVAVSGGPDSLALLEVLLELRPMLRLTLTAAHFEHGIRGQASRDDADFVQCFCAERGVTCRIGSADVPADSRRSGLSLETAARQLRYAFLRRTAEEAGARAVCVAHHADDQAETVLMHLLRGTGKQGLSGMRAVSRQEGLVVLRLLLPFTKKQLLAYDDERKLQPRHDETNDVPEGLRNRIRLLLLPELEKEYNPQLVRGLCQLAELEADENDCLEALAEERLPLLVTRLPAVPERQLPEGAGLDARLLCEQPRALARRLVRAFLSAHGYVRDLSFERIEAVLRLAGEGETGRRIELPGFCLCYDHGFLRFGSPDGQKG
jgi:tRNA(Ile)-lysidine synthase